MNTTTLTSCDTYHLDDQVGYILRLVSQRHATIFQNHTINSLTPTQFAALMRIHEVSSCSQNKLGRLTAMDGATIKGVVDRLDRKGLLCLTPDSHDKRRTVISLSEKASGIISELQKIGATITQETLADLNQKEQQELLRLLVKLT